MRVIELADFLMESQLGYIRKRLKACYFNFRKAVLISRYYLWCFSSESSNALTYFLYNFIKTPFKFECIDFKTMYDVISSLDKTKATGYDGISSKILGTSISELCIPLTNLFNKCIKTCIFPRQLKCANVTPIFKKENPLMKKNYRPVSILTAVSKIFEKIIALQLQNFQNTVYHPYILFQLN